MDDQTPEPIQPPPPERPGLKDKATEAVKDKGVKAAKKVAQGLARKALIAIGQAIASAASAIVAAVGWPVLIVAIIVLIVVAAISCSLYSDAAIGIFGKSSPKPAGKDSQIIADLKGQNIQPAKNSSGQSVSGYHRLDYKNNQDKDYADSGQIDVRLAEALKYLANKHDRIAISHIISDYVNMDTNPESGADRDPQLVANVSAHKDGLAADVAEIDFVYKVWKEHCACNPYNACQPLGDIVYYGDNSSGINNQYADLFGIPTSLDDIGAVNESVNQNVALVNEQLNRLTNMVPAISAVIPNPFGDKITITANLINQVKNNIQSNIDRLKQTQAAINTLKQTLEANQGKSAEGKLSAEQINKINQQISDLQNKMRLDVFHLYSLYNNLEGISNNLDNHLSNPQANATAPIDQLKQSISQIQSDLDAIQSMGNIGFIQDINSPINQALDKANQYLDWLNTQIQNFTPNLTNIANIDNALNNLTGSIETFGGAVGGQNELLRLYCQGTLASITPNTTYDSRPAQAIPIKVSWQDTKPNIAHVGSAPDEGLTTDPRVYFSVYRPEARRKVHQVISELLQFPYDKVDWRYYRVTQLITFSKSRDVNPFSAKLDKLYDKIRPANYGLFSMPESWPHVHIAY